MLLKHYATLRGEEAQIYNQLMRQVMFYFLLGANFFTISFSIDNNAIIYLFRALSLLLVIMSLASGYRLLPILKK